MRKTTLVFLFLALAVMGCKPAPQQLSVSQQIIGQKCSEAGYKDIAYNDCVAAETGKYNKQHAAEIQKAAKEAERAQRAEVKAIEDADKAKCYGLGFKRGTNGFAACMLKVQEFKAQEQVQRAQEQTLRAQEQARQYKIEKLREAAGLCNSSRSIDTGYGTEADQWNRLSSSDFCTKAQVLALELGLDPSKVINPIPVARRPARITCNRFGDTTNCTQW